MYRKIQNDNITIFSIIIIIIINFVKKDNKITFNLFIVSYLTDLSNNRNQCFN